MTHLKSFIIALSKLMGQNFVKSCTYCLLENDIVDIIPEALPFFSSVCTMQIRVYGSTSATKLL